MHGWDLATATGQLARLDPRVAEAALSLAGERLTSEVRARSTAFGEEQPVPEDALAYVRLAGFLGRPT